MFSDFPFQGIHTPMTLHNYLIILFAILAYALATSWLLIFGMRLLRPVWNTLFGPLLHLPGLLPVLLMFVGALLWFGTANGGGIVVFAAPVLLLAGLFGYAHTLVVGPLALLSMVAVFAVVYLPFGVLTGIGWMGLIPYMVFCFKSWRLYV